MSLPEVIAHRGYTLGHRENSLAAFQAALALGANGIELDVHATLDGVVVVHHDPMLSPASPGEERVRIASLTLAQLRPALSAAREIPTLHEVLEAVAGRATVYVEIKAPGIEARVCEALEGCAGWSAVHSFDHRTIARAREIQPRIARGVLMSSYLIDSLGPLRSTAARDLWQQWELIDPKLIHQVHGVGGRVIAWTINALDSTRQLIDWGVDGLCTDRLHDILHLVRGLGGSHISPRRPSAS